MSLLSLNKIMGFVAITHKKMIVYRNKIIRYQHLFHHHKFQHPQLHQTVCRQMAQKTYLHCMELLRENLEKRLQWMLKLQ